LSNALDKKISELVLEIPGLIRNFSYRKGPDLYFYRRTHGVA
jgi:hypothetical protein